MLVAWMSSTTKADVGSQRQAMRVVVESAI
jgi:hypothetical protein